MMVCLLIDLSLSSQTLNERYVNIQTQRHHGIMVILLIILRYYNVDLYVNMITKYDCFANIYWITLHHG